MPETKNTSTKAQPETAESKVRRALEANPGATAAQLAEGAGVGRSTATKILSRWAADGMVTRTTGKDQSVPVTWTLPDEDRNDEAAETNAGEDTPLPAHEPAVDTARLAAPSGAATADAPKKERLPKGALYDMVLAFLKAHPGEEFGPAKIGAELVRSSGAVNNALEKLVTNGLATKTCEAPKRFTSS
ncbi:helix-turn-helix domain-containing protein [Amycolatopsis sp. Hca4]|uniref:MarR family transcriptional regulator n=1 Tax=Amycolatopsis sp. Hca4 TaxID=2742131 RepID=UPI0015917108|nr:helix-turn-helix domain-containing protein [Amycolatopsis sp. Hca4]QKV80716.1 MarR family transcriptional regulator [Amycolatopsis sp. Hca4]